MRSGHHHACSAYRTRENDEKVEIPGHDVAADQSENDSKNATDEGADGATEPKAGGQREANQDTSRNAEQDPPIGLKRIGCEGEHYCADRSEDDCDDANVAGQPSAEKETDVKADKTIEKRKPCVK